MCGRGAMGIVAPKVEMEPDAADFVREQGLERELSATWNVISRCFSSDSRVKVRLVDAPEEDEEDPSLVLALDCPLSRTDFRNARKLFYRRLRTEGCSHLCDLIAIVRG